MARREQTRRVKCRDPLATGGCKDLFAKDISEEEAARGSDEAIVSDDAAGQLQPAAEPRASGPGRHRQRAQLACRMGHRARQRWLGVRISSSDEGRTDARFEAYLDPLRNFRGGEGNTRVPKCVTRTLNGHWVLQLHTVVRLSHSGSVALYRSVSFLRSSPFRSTRCARGDEAAQDGPDRTARCGLAGRRLGCDSRSLPAEAGSHAFPDRKPRVPRLVWLPPSGGRLCVTFAFASAARMTRQTPTPAPIA